MRKRLHGSAWRRSTTAARAWGTINLPQIYDWKRGSSVSRSKPSYRAAPIGAILRLARSIRAGWHRGRDQRDPFTGYGWHRYGCRAGERRDKVGQAKDRTSGIVHPHEAHRSAFAWRDLYGGRRGKKRSGKLSPQMKNYKRSFFQTNGSFA